MGLQALINWYILESIVLFYYTTYICIYAYIEEAGRRGGGVGNGNCAGFDGDTEGVHELNVSRVWHGAPTDGPTLKAFSDLKNIFSAYMEPKMIDISTYPVPDYIRDILNNIRTRLAYLGRYH